MTQVDELANRNEESRGASGYDDPTADPRRGKLTAQKIPHSRVEVRDILSIELWPDHSVPRGN